MLVLSRASKIEYVSNKHIANLTLCEQRCSQMITLQKEEEEKMRKQREVRILKETRISTQFLKSEVLKVNIRYLPGGRSVWEKALLKFKRLKARAALKNDRSDLN